MRTRTLISIEYVLKGVFLGLLYVGATRAAAVSETLSLFAVSTGCLALVLSLQTFRQFRQAKRSRAHLLASVILAILDHPAAVYASLLGGFAGGAVYLGLPVLELAAASLIGAVVGAAGDATLRLRSKWLRRLALAVLAAAVVAGVGSLFHFDWVAPAGDSVVVGLSLILGCMLFYILTFAGRGEETEPEIAVICIGLAVALAQLSLPPLARGLVVVLPMAFFVVYCERVRRHLVVFKCVLRGLSHEQSDDLRNALFWYRQALQRNPKSELAIAGNWRVHRKIDLASLADDDEIVSMIDPLVCLERARSLLNAERPTEPMLEEAGKLLDIVECRRKDLPQVVGHERLRRAAFEQDSQAAIDQARSLVQPPVVEVLALPDHELDALFRTWCKILQDPLLVSGGGPEWLDETEMLFRFLAVLERRLKQIPDDRQANSFKPFMYAKLTLPRYEQYLRAHEEDPVDWLDYRFCVQLAQQSADDGDTGRAIELLRIAELGSPHDRLILWSQIADLHAKDGSAEATRWRQRVKELGLQIGPKQLSEASEKAFYRTVRQLGEQAMQDQNWKEAIDDFEILSDWEHTGVATLKILKELYERSGDVASAIRPVEIALRYSLSDAQVREWAAEKARLYAAVTAEQVTPRLGKVAKYFDFQYCYRRAVRLFDEKQDPEAVIHFLDLAALGGQRMLLNVNCLLGRSYYRQGNLSDAVLCLEHVKSNRPEHFEDEQQKDAYFSACRLLGDIYLDHLDEPAKAIDCYSIYKDHTKSGAETLYRLACAYERNGQPAHARKWYDMVLVYPGHPRAEDAKRALAKLGN